MLPHRLLRRAGLLGAAFFTGLLGSSCSSTDSMHAAQRALDRALQIEPTSAFLASLLARVRGESVPGPVPAQARQYYLSVIAETELIGPGGRERLQREGLLGNTFTLKTLAQWRLGRLDAARDSLAQVRASGQEALNLRERALLTAFEGVSKIEYAIVAAQAGESVESIFALIAGENGAWRLLGAARAESARSGNAPPAEFLEARLAAFKVLKDAIDAQPSGTSLPTTIAEAWPRLRAEAQVELREFARLPTTDPSVRSARVTQWQRLCGLDPPT